MNDVLSVVGTVATVPGIIAITNLAKGLGLSGRWSALVAVVLGVVLSVGQWAFADQGWWGAATTGLLLGLGAAGLYDLTPSSKTAASDGLPDGVSASDVGTPAPSVGVDPTPAPAATAKTAAPAAGLPDATTATTATATPAQAATTPAAAAAQAAATAATAATNATA